MPKRKTKGRREKTAAMVSPRHRSQPSLVQPRQMLMNEGIPNKYSPPQGFRNVNQPTYAAECIPSPQKPYASWYPPYFPPLVPPTTQQLPAGDVNPNYALCSVGLNTRLFTDIKFNDKIVRALFEPDSCCTYLGKRALDKFPEVQIRSNLSTTSGIIYPYGLIENTTGEAIIMVEISEVSKPRKSI